MTRTRAGFKWDHAPALRQAHALIDRAPLPSDAFADGVARFSELVSFGRELPAHFFKVKRTGAITMGVGSALDEKYLIIFEGETTAPEDDLVVEAKQMRDLAGNPCVRTDVGASRVLEGQRLIAYEPFRLRGRRSPRQQVLLDARLDGRLPGGPIGTALRSARELRELAFDAGVQMGRAHPKRPDGGPDKDRREAVARAIDAYETRVRAAIRDMAAKTEAAWGTFRAAAT